MTNATRLIRIVLALGSAVFLVSALFLLLAPGMFATALGLSDGDAVNWAMRMMGACLLGLSGQMWLVRRAGDASVRAAAGVMIVAGGTMTILTLVIPAEWTPMRWAYLAFGGIFVILYVVLLLAGGRTRQ
ncbi:MAG: hypothetical protein ORN20_08435 [Candidatus Nanopelagicales bacterium]|jgi:hypothetical protein|nr:hypothetical protein [Candidatus Nanopelagicales bacterium]